MDEDRMPTLFEILNRFSKPPVDLWSFYIYLKEHYGGVEYLEFWLDCASHQALCKDIARGIHKAHTKRLSGIEKQRSLRPPVTGLRVDVQASNSYDPINPALTSQARRAPSAEERSDHTPSSSVLFDILKDENLESSPESTNNSLHGSKAEEQDVFDIEGPHSLRQNRFSTLSYERARNKRDTVSRLSEILDTMQMPTYPNATATSPTRDRKASQELDFNSDGPESFNQATSNDASRRLHIDSTKGTEELKFPQSRGGEPPRAPPPDLTLTATTMTSQPHNTRVTSPYLDTALPARGRTLNGHSRNRQGSFSRRDIHQSALRIINTYLTPKGTKEIELPTNQQGWSMAEDIRQLASIPGGLDDPRLFDNATTYVFEALEREALPGFLQHSALSNVQPVSATLRLCGGLLALFGGFWLSFVYILLDWQPKSHRCWVLLPFSFGWYLTISGLYHIDPLLAFAKLCERDGGGIAHIQENFVKKMLIRRGIFVLTSTVLMTAAFCVLFILVPGHRL